MPVPSAPAMYRASDVGVPSSSSGESEPSQSERTPKPEPDQVDRLFGVTTD